MKKIKHRGIEKLKARYGLLFITPWIIGIVLFFMIPLVQSIMYSFSDIVLKDSGMVMNFQGLKHYKFILFESPTYTQYLKTSVLTIVYQFPFIVVLSMILAILLNRNFKGRLFFRMLYFLPVIIATGIAMNLILSTTTIDASGSSSQSISDSIVDVADIMSFLNLPISIATPVKNIINNIFDLVWNCGIQIILFISGLQSIPNTVYEACDVEGATKWEQFWFITFPMLGRVTMLVCVFTMIELFTDARNQLMNSISTQMRAGTYDQTSAMLWFYFIIVGGIVGIVLFLYNKYLLKKWE